MEWRKVEVAFWSSKKKRDPDSVCVQECSLGRGEREEKQKEHGSQVGCPDTILWIVSKGSGKDKQTLPRMSVE